MKLLTTNRLFYRTYPYKAVLLYDWTTAASLLKEADMDKIDTGKDYASGRSTSKYKANPATTREFRIWLDSYTKKDLRTRVEGYSLTLFFKDRKIVDELENRWPGIVEELYEPANNLALDHMLSAVRTEVRPRLTHGCRYKIYLNGDIKNIPDSVRKRVDTTFKKNPENYVVPTSVRRVFEGDARFFWGTTYFYARDSKFLLMIQMLIQPLIKETVTIVTNEELKEKEANEQ